MWLGDQVYSDAVSETSVREQMAKDPSVTDELLIETYRHLYRGFFNERGYRELTESLPTYLMWDDHDIFDGWGSLIDRTEFDERVYRAAEQAYREYQHLRNPTGSLASTAPYGTRSGAVTLASTCQTCASERDFEKGARDGRLRMGAASTRFLKRRPSERCRQCSSAPACQWFMPRQRFMTALERLKTSSGRDVRDRWSRAHTSPASAPSCWSASSHGSRRDLNGRSSCCRVTCTWGPRSTSARARGPGRFAQWTSSALSTPDGLKHVVANRIITSFVRVGEHELRVWRQRSRHEQQRRAWWRWSLPTAAATSSSCPCTSTTPGRISSRARWSTSRSHRRGRKGVPRRDRVAITPPVGPSPA